MANRPVVKEIQFQGITIAVEYENGSIVQKTTDSGPITHVFYMDYGFFPGAIISPQSGLPSDGEPLDAMVSPDDPEAPTAYVILQKAHGKQPAQLKVVLGTTEEGAVKLFLAHRPEELFGGVYGSLSVTNLRAALEDWRGTLPLEMKRMRLPRMQSQMNSGILHVLADFSLTRDMLPASAQRGFDAIRSVESALPRAPQMDTDWARKTASSPWNPSGHMRTIDEKSRRIDFVSSTSEIDRYDSIIDQDWRLENYRKNPIVLWCHNIDGLPMGTTVPESLRTDRIGSNDVLLSTVQVATPQENPMAEWVLQCYVSGALRAISVRFDPEGYQWEEVQGRSICHYLRPELVEQSLCTVPGNASTLAVRELRDMQTRMISALERTALVIAPARSYSLPASTTTPAAPAVHSDKTESTTMRLACKAEKSAVTHLLRHGDLEVNCPGCKSGLSIEISDARDLEGRVQQASVEKAEAMARSADTAKQLVEMTNRAVAAETKNTELERRIADLTKDLAEAKDLAATARKDADAATRRTAEIELSLIVGPNDHELTPVEQRDLAELAVSDPTRYANLRNEKFSKYHRKTGIDPAKALLAAGRTAPDGQQRGAAPTGAPPVGADPTPPWLGQSHQRDGGGFGQPAGAAPPPSPPNGGTFNQLHAQLHGGNAGDGASLYDKLSIG
jgi:hypothetical protein